MSPLLFAIILMVSASVIAIIMLWSALPHSYWQVTDYVCGPKKAFGLTNSPDLIVLVIERDRAGEERAWCRELGTGTRTPLPPDDVRHLIATFTRYGKE